MLFNYLLAAMSFDSSCKDCLVGDDFILKKSG